MTPQQQHGSILRRMYANYMTYGLGLVILVIVILILIAAILAAIFAGLGWEKCGDDDDGYSSLYCDDGNQCTKDRKEDGVCFFYPRPNNYPCESACFDPEEDEDITHNCTNIVDCGDCVRCEGTTCAGACTSLDGSDCPNITTTSVVTSAVKDCDSNACNYYIDMTDLHSSTGIPCASTSAYWADVCLNEINQSSAFIEDDCLLCQPQCSNSTLDTEGQPQLVACYCWFYCANPVAVVIL